MRTIGKGTKIKFLLDVDGLSGVSKLSETDNFRIDFYAKEKKDSTVTAYDTVMKDDSTRVKFIDEQPAAINGPGVQPFTVENCYVICDTSTLDLGIMYATLTVEYTDTATNAPLKEVLLLTTDIKIEYTNALDEQIWATLSKFPVTGNIYMIVGNPSTAVGSYAFGAKEKFRPTSMTDEELAADNWATNHPTNAYFYLQVETTSQFVDEITAHSYRLVIKPGQALPVGDVTFKAVVGTMNGSTLSYAVDQLVDASIDFEGMIFGHYFYDPGRNELWYFDKSGMYLRPVEVPHQIVY